MDASQFKQCFLPCHEQLFRMAWRLTGNTQAAEDLVQETFLKLWMKRDELATIDSYEGFSVTTLKRRVFKIDLKSCAFFTYSIDALDHQI